MTPRRDLRSPGPLWLRGPMPRLGLRRKPARAHYDVAIVGAGVSGALAAARLIGLGLSVVILDRRPPARGSTAASTAMIQWEIDEPLTGLAGKIGQHKAKQAYRASLKGVLELRQLVFTHRIACNWVDRTALTVAGDAMGQRALAAELEARQRLGLPSTWLGGDQLEAMYGMRRTAALVNGFNAEADPLQLALGLLQHAAADGMEIVSPVDVTTIASEGNRAALGLSGGGAITADKVIVCAGYEALPEIPRHRYKLVSTWAIASQRLPPTEIEALLPGRPLIWEQSDPYLYLRTTADNRIVAGGEDAAFNDPERRDRLTSRKTKAILKKLSAFVPGLDLTADYAWAGTFAESPTGLPAIGAVPGLPRVFTTLGAGGNGITFSAIAAGLARDWITGVGNPDSGLFALT